MFSCYIFVETPVDGLAAWGDLAHIVRALSLAREPNRLELGVLSTSTVNGVHDDVCVMGGDCNIRG